MTTEKKRNKLYWIFKFLGVVISCALPVWAICEKFPLWREDYGTDHTVGVGAILIAIVIAIITRKTIFKFFAERLKLKHAPPIFVWIVLLIISYVMIFIADFIVDLTVVLWMGILGCAIGTVFTYIAENHFGKKDDSNG
jgi:hypothetical protein